MSPQWAAVGVGLLIPVGTLLAIAVRQHGQVSDHERRIAELELGQKEIKGNIEQKLERIWEKISDLAESVAHLLGQFARDK